MDGARGCFTAGGRHWLGDDRQPTYKGGTACTVGEYDDAKGLHICGTCTMPGMVCSMAPCIDSGAVVTYRGAGTLSSSSKLPNRLISNMKMGWVILRSVGWHVWCAPSEIVHWCDG
jgi:hypothetical protein